MMRVWMYLYVERQDIKIGTIPKAETERDANLIEDYLKGDQENGWEYSISELGLKYARIEDGKTIPLTATRIHQILNKHGIEKARVPEKKKKKKRVRKAKRTA